MVVGAGIENQLFGGESTGTACTKSTRSLAVNNLLTGKTTHNRRQRNAGRHDGWFWLSGSS